MSARTDHSNSGDVHYGHSRIDDDAKSTGSPHDTSCVCSTCVHVSSVGKYSIEDIQCKFNINTSHRIQYRRSVALVTAVYERVVELAQGNKELKEVMIHGGDDNITIVIFYNDESILYEFSLPALPVGRLDDILTRAYSAGHWMDYSKPLGSYGAAYSCSLRKELDFF